MGEEEVQQVSESSSSNKKIILFIVIGLIVIGLVIAGIIYFSNKGNGNGGIIPIIPVTGASEDSPFGVHNSDTDSDGFDSTQMNDIGAKWLRTIQGGLFWQFIEKEKGVYDWADLDNMALKAQENDINLIVVSTSINDLDQGDTKENKGSRTIPKNMAWYKEFLGKAVERYDGDGIDDASGSPIIKYWEIENEVNGGEFGDTPENYALLLKESYKTIKSVNPNAVVIISGMAQAPGNSANQFDFFFSVFKELDRIRDNSGDKYFDVMNIHLYNFPIPPELKVSKNVAKQDIIDDGLIKDYASKFRTEADKYNFSMVIWMTETGTYSGTPIMKNQPVETQTEAQHAKDVVRIYVNSLGNGITKIFWVTLLEWSGFNGVTNGLWDNFGLVNNPKTDGESSKKLAYYTFKLMTEKLEGSDWSDIEVISESNGIYAYKFNKDGKSIWVVWNDNTGNKEISFSIGNLTNAKITEAVPKYNSGTEVLNYETAFNVGMGKISGGKLTITVGQSPVYIEATSENLSSYIPTTYSKTTGTTSGQTITPTQQKPAGQSLPPGVTPSCGDGFCGMIERQNNSCPADCE